MVVENYPQLKSDANFQRLMDELSGTENRIAVARGRYNERIQEYNTTRRRFPSNMTAKIFGFEEYPYFEAPSRRPAGAQGEFRASRQASHARQCGKVIVERFQDSQSWQSQRTHVWTTSRKRCVRNSS